MVFRLTGWSPPVPTGFLVSRGTLDPAGGLAASGTGLSPPLAGFPKAVPLPLRLPSAVRTPPCSHGGLASFPFARRYLGNRCFFLFLWLLRCFSSPGALPRAMCSPAGGRASPGRVPPFRNPWLIAACHVFHRPPVPRHPPRALTT